jgi:CP12 domain
MIRIPAFPVVVADDIVSLTTILFALFTESTLKMKFTISTIALLAASAQAFSPIAFTRPNMVLKASTADAAEQLIKDAVAISEKYGKNSPEARLAWETVEEVNASDNRYVSLRLVPIHGRLVVRFPILLQQSHPYNRTTVPDSLSIANSFIHDTHPVLLPWVLWTNAM